MGLIIYEVGELSGFSDLSGLDAAGADFHTQDSTFGLLGADRLQVGIKAPSCPIISV